MNDIQARLNILAPERRLGRGRLLLRARSAGQSRRCIDSAGRTSRPYERGDRELSAEAPVREARCALRHTKTVRVFVEACFSGSSDGGRLEGVSPVYQEPAFPEAGDGHDDDTDRGDGDAACHLGQGGGARAVHPSSARCVVRQGRPRTRTGEVTAREAKAYLDRYMTSNAWILRIERAPGCGVDDEDALRGDVGECGGRRSVSGAPGAVRGALGGRKGARRRRASQSRIQRKEPAKVGRGGEGAWPAGA